MEQGFSGVINWIARTAPIGRIVNADPASILTLKAFRPNLWSLRWLPPAQSFVSESMRRTKLIWLSIQRVGIQAASLVLAATLLGAPASAGARAQADAPCTLNDAFLNQLMLAESGGRLHAKNPRSSALGPYQFIRSTFLEVTLRHFGHEIGAKTHAEILGLRTDYKFSRRIADAYSRENAAFLHARGHKATPAHLRLAFFAGPAGAAKIIGADPDTPASSLLSGSALSANPFLRRMTAQALLDRSARDVRLAGTFNLYPNAGSQTATKPPQIRVRCNLARASCRKWLFLAKKRLQRKQAGQRPGRIASVTGR